MNYFLRKNNWARVKEYMRCDPQYSDFEYNVEAIFKSYMCSAVDSSIWIDILQNAYSSQTHTMSIDYSKELSKRFAFSPIQEILGKTTLSNFVKERQLKGVLLSWEPYRYDKAFYSEFLSFSVTQWEYFTEMFPHWIDKDVSPERMIKDVHLTNPNTLPFSATLNDYNRFPYESIQFQNLSGGKVPLSSVMIENYFDPVSHFENGTFWLKNETPYVLLNANNEVLSEKIFATDSLLHCPWNCCKNRIKDRVKDFLQKKTPFEYRFLQKILHYSGKQSIYTIVEKYFHILGRVSKHFPLYPLHESFRSKIKKNILHLDKIDEAPKQLLFPEYYFQNTSVQQELDNLWDESKSQFMNELSNFLLENFYMVFYLHHVPKHYQSIQEDLTFSIGKDYLFDYISKHRRLVRFINLDTIYMKEQKKEKCNTIRDQAVVKMENYLDEIIQKKKHGIKQP